MTTLAQVETAPLAMPALRLPRTASLAGDLVPGERLVPEETAVAFSYNGTTHAVMMATPADLEDFAIGLSLTEGIIGTVDDIADLEIVSTDLGIELRMWVPDAHMRPYGARRRLSASAPSSAPGLCAASGGHRRLALTRP